MRPFTILASVCAVATLLLPSGATSVLPRQVTVPPNEQIFDGPLIRFQSSGSAACKGPLPTLAEVVAINPQVWGSGSHCGHQVSVTFNGTSHTGIVVDECKHCPPNSIGLFPVFFQQVTGITDIPFVEGSWNFVF